MLAFSTDELNTVFRSEVVDKLEGVDADHPDSECLWSNADVYRYMTEALDRLAKDTEELSKIFTRPVVPTEQFVSLPRNVVKIRTARLVTKNIFLKPYNMGDVVTDQYNDYGDYHTGRANVFVQSGSPQFYIGDYKKNNIMLGPIPGTNDADTIEFQATVTIAVPAGPNMPLPFMDTEDQRLLLLHMKSQAYAKQDADTLDLARSESFEAQYNAKVSERKFSLLRLRREPGVVRMDG